MMLAALVVLCLMVTGAAAWLALRTKHLPAALLVFTAGVAPLVAFALMQTRAQPSRSAYVFEVKGQFHPLTRNVSIGQDSTADLLLPDLGDSTTVRLALKYAADAAQVTLRLERADVPIFWGGEPVNAKRVGRKVIIATKAGSEITVSKPWWCWLRCDDIAVKKTDGTIERFHLRDGARRFAADETPVTLFRTGWRDYVAADPRAGLTVDAEGLRDVATGSADSLRVGVSSRAPLLGINVNAAAHRIELSFRSGFGRMRWDLPTGLSDPARFLVSANTHATLPGTAPVLNPAAVAPGAAKQPYGGIIEYGQDGWEWRQHGQVTPIRSAEPLLLPGTDAQRTGGHIVTITQRDPQMSNALLAASVAWVLGVGLLAWSWRWLHGLALASRVAVLGSLYTLVFVRGALAFRAWLAPPNHAGAAAVFIGLLIALPTLVAAYHWWEENQGKRNTRWVARELMAAAGAAAPIWIVPVIAIAIVSALVLPEWRGRILITAFAPIAAGIPGLLLLRGLLVARHVPVHGPLGVLDESAARDYAYRHLASAIVALVFLGAVLGLVSQVVDHGRLLALCFTAVIGVAAMGFATGPRAFMRPPRNERQLIIAGSGALVPALGTYWISRSWWLALIIGVISAGAAWLLARHTSTLRIRPFGLRDALRPGFMLVVFAGLIALTALGLMSNLRVLAEYALTIAGLLVIARIFAILWFRQADDALQRSIDARARARHTPSMFGLGAILVLALAVYIPLGAHDPGLALLFFSAAAITATVGLAATGMRTTVLGLGMLVLLVSTFFVSMFVRPATLNSGTAHELSTPEIRYAAAMTPAALERHLISAPVSQGTKIINTLQQDWGQRYYTGMAGTTGRGYFGTDFLDRGVTTPVALAENVFAVFLMSEHGWLGAIAVLLAYAALVLVLFGAATWACRDRHQVPRGILLAGLATFWAVPTLYMVAANASLLPLTGQNVPLLGLLSPADVALSCLLSALALTALPVPSAVQAGEHATVGARLRPIRRVIGLTATATAALFVLLGVSLWKPAHEEPGDFRLDVFAEHVQQLVNSGALSSSGDAVSVSGAAAKLEAFQRGNFLAHTIDVSNRIGAGQRPAGGACFNRDPLVRVATDESVQVTRAFCGLSTAASGLYAWRGSLRSAGEPARPVITDGASAIVFGAKAPDAQVEFGAGCSKGVTYVRMAQLGCAERHATVRFGSTALTIEPALESGLQVNSKAARDVSLLSAGERIHTPEQDLLVTAVPAGAVAYTRWENGAWRRIADPETSPWLVQLDSQIARANSTRKAQHNDAIVTVDADLHHALGRTLGPACAALREATACSVLLADPKSGAIVGFAQWHARAASFGKFRPIDANLRNHPAASSIKPIIAAAALHAYPALAQLEVPHRDAAYVTVANTPLGDTMRAARRFPDERVNWNGFLGASDNLYAVSLGFLAGARRGDGGLPRRAGSVNTAGLAVSGKPLTGRPAFPGRLGLHESPLAESLNELFGATAAENAPAYDDEFWKRATQAGVLRRSGDLQRIAPEPTALAMNTIRDARAFASFLIGGGTNRWNNVALVEAFSRIYTGQPIQLYLLEKIGDEALAPDVQPVPELAAASKPVRDGLRAVTTQPWGTGYSLRTAFAPHRVDWIAKTGTLAEPDWTGSIILFAGSAADQNQQVCPTAGIVTIELRRGANPDGKATQMFREQIAGLLREHRGWGDRACN